MGLVLPWILRALADHADANRTVRLYAANLMGGIAGMALVMWLGLPRLGLFTSGEIAIGLNLVAAVIAAALTRHVPRGAEPVPTAPVASSGIGTAPWIARGLAFLSGFLVLAAEVVVQHQFAQVTTKLGPGPSACRGSRWVAWV
jgi:predicted membrane-bound spermidine synthase